MKSRRVDPMLGNILDAGVRYHDDLRHRLERHRPCRAGVRRHNEIGL